MFSLCHIKDKVPFVFFYKTNSQISRTMEIMTNESSAGFMNFLLFVSDGGTYDKVGYADSLEEFMNDWKADLEHSQEGRREWYLLWINEGMFKEKNY